MFDNREVYVMHEDLPLEMNLCSLLQNMKLDFPQDEKSAVGLPIIAIAEQSAADIADDVIPDETSYHSDGESCSSSSLGSDYNNLDEDIGCAYLQSLKSQLSLFETTGGGYLETIFTHREISMAYPAGHTQCARAFSDIAYALEQRAWRADREADTEAVSTFRNEAWMIASTMRAPQETITAKQAPFVCKMRSW